MDIIIECSGDPSVGIFGASWTIENVGHMDDIEFREDIRRSFKESFEMLTDFPCHVIFDDEIPPE